MPPDCWGWGPAINPAAMGRLAAQAKDQAEGDHGMQQSTAVLQESEHLQECPRRPLPHHSATGVCSAGLRSLAVARYARDLTGERGCSPLALSPDWGERRCAGPQGVASLLAEALASLLGAARGQKRGIANHWWGGHTRKGASHVPVSSQLCASHGT